MKITVLNIRLIAAVLVLSAQVFVQGTATPCKAAVQEQSADTVRYLFVDGMPQGYLYLPMNGSNATLRFAAQELQEHLRAITGNEMPMAYRQAKPNQSGLILTVLPKAEWTDNASPQGFSIRQDPCNCRVEITGNTSLAVLYGVYQYLENLGVRWYAPGELGTHLPSTADIPIKAGVEHYAPSFESRSMALSSVVQNNFNGSNAEQDFYEYQLYLMRNRTMLTRFAATQGMFEFNIDGTGSGHTIKPMAGLTPRKVEAGLMEKSPERFALVTGKDGVKQRHYSDGQICFTNQENIDTAIENAVLYFDELEQTKSQRGSDLDYQYTVPMGLSDTTGICECDECARVAGLGPQNKDRLVWSFWNKVARGLADRKPSRLLAVFSPYMEMTSPPSDVNIEPNIMVVTALVTPWEKSDQDLRISPFPKTYLNRVLRLREAGAKLACYDYLNFPWSPTPLIILDAAKGYWELGYKHYHVEAMQRSEYAWPLIWALAQYTWNANTDPYEYLREYCENYYGEPGQHVVLALFEELTENALKLERLNYGSAADTSYMFPDDTIKKYRQQLRHALALAQGKQQRRLKRFIHAIETQFLFAETYRAFCQALNTRKLNDVYAFRSKANALVTYWDTNHLNEYSNLYRTPKVAAKMLLAVEFEKLKPVMRSDLQGVLPGDSRWKQALFSGQNITSGLANVYPLPEIWQLHIDANATGSAVQFSDPAYDTTHHWQPVSTWNFISSQGYTPQISGYYWYRLAFDAPTFPENERVYLRIGALDDSGDIYLNGKLAGSQPDPNKWDHTFELDITEHLKQGQENILLIHGFDSGGAEGVWRPSALYTR